MEHERDVAEYRARLLDMLGASARRSACGASDQIHVFVNQRRVGSLDGAGDEATIQVQTHGRIESVHLRSEDGVLLGGLSAPEYGARTSRIPLTRSAVELRVHNNPQGGSLSAVFTPSPRLWHRAWGVLSDIAVRKMAAAVAPGVRAIAFTQVMLAFVVMGLAADRITAWINDGRKAPFVTPAEVPWAAPLTEITKLENQLDDLARLQAKAVDSIQMQQQGMAQLQREISNLSSTQETVASSVLTVRKEIEKRQKGSSREVERMAHLLMSKTQSEQEQLEAEIHSLTVANGNLSKEMAILEQHNQDLKKRLKSAGLDVSKATVLDRDKPLVARQSEAVQPPQVAEVRPTTQPQPFLFWVTFSDGTSQESIDQWVREMHGHKGALSEGWQAVEVVPATEPPDRFLEQIRRAKIVKAVRTSR